MNKSALLAFVLVCVLFSASTAMAQTDGPRVVVSIKPIHSLVSGLMEGVAEPTLLIKGSGSPHGYVLRPSEARALADADLVIWVGHALETFMEKPLKTLSSKAASLELLDALEDDLLTFRSGDEWDEHDHAGDHYGHGKTDVNPHVWLNPKLAIKIVASTTQALSDLDPANRNRYTANASCLTQKLEELDKNLADKLAPVKERPYIVFHDAYQYFEDAYQLNSAGSLTVSPERKPGAKKIYEIRKRIQESGAVCVFSEPQFEPRLIATLIEGTNVRTGILDPLGADLPEGTDSYFVLLNNLADNLVEGLR